MKAIAASLAELAFGNVASSVSTASKRARASARQRVSRAAEVAAITAQAGVDRAVFTTGAAVGIAEGETHNPCFS